MKFTILMDATVQKTHQVSHATFASPDNGMMLLTRTAIAPPQIRWTLSRIATRIDP